MCVSNYNCDNIIIDNFTSNNSLEFIDFNFIDPDMPELIDPDMYGLIDLDMHELIDPDMHELIDSNFALSHLGVFLNYNLTISEYIGLYNFTQEIANDIPEIDN